MKENTKKLIEQVTDSEIRSAIRILLLLEAVAWEKMDFDRASAYCHKIQMIEADIDHIKDLI